MHLNVCAGKVVRLRQKLSDITGAVTGIFGRKAEKDPAVAKLDALKVRANLFCSSIPLLSGNAHVHFAYTHALLRHRCMHLMPVYALAYMCHTQALLDVLMSCM